MLRALAWLGQSLVVAPALYSTVVSLWGLRAPTSTPAGASRRRMRVVVPAHDEAAVIGGIAEDLAAQTHPHDRLDVRVIADRCTDDTAAIAGAHVPVVERHEGEGGKGATIAWHLDAEPLGDDDGLVVLDADNRVPQDFVARLAAALDRGDAVVQAYLDVENPGDSVLTTANALTYWASNRSVQVARTTLGWPCDLGGTGMAFTAGAWSDAGGVGDDLTEDAALNARLALAGHRAVWLHDVRLRDEKPSGVRSSVVQRARWVSGKRSVRRRYGTDLIRAGLAGRDWGLVDLAYRLYNPGRSFLALLIGLLAVASAIWPSSALWPAWLLGAIALVVVAMPMVFLAVDRIPGRWIVRYPYVAVIAILWLPIRVASRFVKGWTRTSHG